MKPITPRKAAAAVLLAAGLVGASAANAASVSYYLDQTNQSPPFNDGTNYLIVTIDDNGGIGANGGDSLITFTVDVINAQFTPTAGAFGIDNFSFNITGDSIAFSDSPNPAWILPTNWSANVVPPPSNQADGFGTFDVQVFSSGAANRKDPLVFSIDVAGDTINSYFAPSTGGAGEGNAWFAAHVAGFVTSTPDPQTCGTGGTIGVNGCTALSSAWFGGGNGENFPPNSVPLPAAVWLFGSGLVGMIGIARRRRIG